MKSIAGTRLLFASARRAIRSQSKGAPASYSLSSSSSSAGDTGLRPPMYVMRRATKSSTSNAPDPDFIARALAALICEKRTRMLESFVASLIPCTGAYVSGGAAEGVDGGGRRTLLEEPVGAL